MRAMPRLIDCSFETCAGTDIRMRSLSPLSCAHQGAHLIVDTVPHIELRLNCCMAVPFLCDYGRLLSLFGEGIFVFVAQHRSRNFEIRGIRVEISQLTLQPKYKSPPYCIDVFVCLLPHTHIDIGYGIVKERQKHQNEECSAVSAPKLESGLIIIKDEPRSKCNVCVMYSLRTVSRYKDVGYTETIGRRMDFAARTSPRRSCGTSSPDVIDK
jgi:hypothetical protein